MTWIVGLTGGIGSGKTQASNVFASLGVPVIDTDLISHALTAPRGLAIEAIRAAFGDEVISASGEMDRKKMRQLVFADPAARQKLEGILHPLIARVALASISQHADAPYVVLVVPLLAESPAWISRCDRILVIDCEVQTQIERIMKRSNLTREEAVSIISQQASREARKAIANEVIVNESSIEHLTQQVTRLHDYYLRLASQSPNAGAPV
ncbi:MAG TPA: dephospho-CoA kinase [Candidatus Aphodousia gallistercoris]|nr:dephospho-CoA kinase [Candidatus Aphodousia gallistercoris]